MSVLLLVALAGVLAAGVVLTALQLPGTWLMVAAAAGYDWYFGWRALGWRWVAGVAAVALAAEVVEMLAGAVLASRAGASRRASFGALAGGFAGMLLLSVPLPIVGTIIGGLIGCFGGAMLAELTHPDRARLSAGEQLSVGARVGLWAALGRLAGLLSKLAAALVIAGVVMVRALAH